MTKKDYELIADVMLIQRRMLNTTDHQRICRSLAKELALDNPKFDQDKFLQACGIETASNPGIDSTPLKTAGWSK